MPTVSSGASGALGSARVPHLAVVEGLSRLQQQRQRAVHRGFHGGRRQVQDPHVLHVGPFPAPLPQRVVGEAEVHGGKELLPEAVAGKGPGLAHQGADDVAVIDVGFTLAMHPLHPFHQVVLVVHCHPVGVQPGSVPPSR